ncbi:TPA: restriction endonuclease subunit S [Staphylococcus aureus]|nr:restriction endonuclease subunit S [Staphylococcus aureus]
MRLVKPDLRFPEFNDEWQNSSISELGEFKKSYSLSRAYEGEGEYYHIHYGDIHSKFPSILNSVKLIPKITEIKNFEEINKDDLIFADASEDYKDLGKAVLVNFSDSKVIAGLHTHLFRPKVLIDSKFLLYNTKTNNYLRFIRKQGTGISVLGISKSNLSKYKLYHPSYKEQRKISDFFSKLDRQIELEEEKLELLEQQKKGYMQQIFSQDLRFKGENGDDYAAWKETTIKEIAEIKTGSKDTKDAREDGNYNFYVRSPIIHKINSYSYDGEAILTVGDGVGVGKVFHYVNGKFDYHQRVYKISDFKNYYGLLLYYYFSKNFLKEARKYNAKTSVDSVRKDMIANMKVPMPIMEEQQKIGMFLKKLESRIDYQNSKINLLKQRKRGFLQKMFV